MTGAPRAAARLLAVPPSAGPAVKFRARHSPYARLGALLGVGLLAYHAIVRFDLATLLGDWDWWAIILFRTQTTAFAVAACVAFVERRETGATRRRLHYIAAIVVANGIAALATLALLQSTDLPYRGPTEQRWVLYIQLEYMLLASGAVFAWLDRRRAHAAQSRLHAAQRRCLDAARAALEVRLQATQARVEPKFLFDTLARVHRLYPQDSARAERLLDALVAYLRAAMPRASDGRTSVRNDIELVSAWLRIEGHSPDGDGQRVDVPAEVLDARVPSMLLLPLVKCAVAGAARPGGARPLVRLAVAVEGARLVLRVACDTVRTHAGVEHALASLRERLDELYGETASLAVLDGPGGSLEAVLDVPLERTAPDAATAATGRSAS